MGDGEDGAGGRRAMATMPEAMDPSTWVSNTGAQKPVLVVLTGPQVGQRITLECRAIIGQDPEADLMLVDDRVEWHHAAVTPKDGGWVVRDLTESRRTEVNGMRVRELMLSDDDQILLGGTVLRFELHGPVEQAYDEAIVERLTRDELTGLLARRAFDIALASAVSAATRQGRVLALLVVDIDGVKAVNDRYGHMAGAGVIAGVGRVIGQVICDEGIACRLGGDEFGLLLQGVGADAACGAAARLCEAVRATEFRQDGLRLPVTVSIGVAGFPDHGAVPLQLLRRADDAMYGVKRGGGDGAAVYVPFAP